MSNYLRKIPLVLAGLLAASAATAAQPQIEGSTLHTLALQADGTVLAWGQDNHGELGQERILSSTTPVQVINLRDIAAISSGMDYSLALGADGTVWAWGANNYGELGDGSKANSATPVQVAGLPAIAHIAAGSGTSLAVASDGSVWGWGWVAESQADYQVRRIAGLENVSAVAAGQFYGLALKQDGSVWAWGLNSNGVLGDGTTTDRWTPAPVSGLTNVTAIAASSAFPHSLALKSDGTVWAWGRDTYGSLGLPDNAETCSDGLNDPVACARLPQQVPGLTDIVAIAADWGKNIALRRDGTVWVWGNGLGTTPQQVGGIGNAAKIAYANGGLALDQAGTLVGWEMNTAALAVETVPALSGLLAIEGNYNFAAALKADGTVWTWGDNRYGQLGLGQVSYSSTPVAVNGLTGVARLSTAAYNNLLAGGAHNLALKDDGTLWAWGMNFSGQLGDGSTTDRAAPVQVPDMSNVVSVAASSGSSFAVKSDGSLWAWGANTNGDLGGGFSDYTVLAPRQVPGIAGATTVSTEHFLVLVLRGDGTVLAWGSNEMGQLGDGTTTARWTPAAVPGVAQAAKAVAGVQSAYVLKTDGGVLAWGANDYGQLGAAATATCAGKSCATAPQAVPGLSGVTDIAAGAGHVLALKSDGTVWSWGANWNGQLGDGGTADRGTPAQVPGLANVVAIAAGHHQSFAVTRDGAVWAWGWNHYGQLGDGTYSLRATPTLVANASIDGPLDLLPAVANEIAADKLPVFYLAAAKSGEPSATRLAVTLKGGTATRATRAAGGSHNVYVAASTGSGLAWFQLDAGGSWGGLAWPMAAFMSGVSLSSRTDSVVVEILDGVDVSGLVGARIYVGYGSSADDMLAAGRYREVFTVTDPNR